MDVRFFLYSLLLLTFYSCSKTGTNDAYAKQAGIKNRIEMELDKAKKSDFYGIQQKLHLENALNTALSVQLDSLKMKYFLKISLVSYQLKDSSIFRISNAKSRNLALSLKDSTRLATAYWDLGNFFLRENIYDSAYSAYFKANTIYSSKGDDLLSARMLINMSITETAVKDYIGSETSTFKAIQLLKPLHKYQQLYNCYNNLGIIYNGLGEYGKAVNYHNEALNYQKKIPQENFLQAATLNNLGVVYENKEDYGKAYRYYSKAISFDSIQFKKPKLYAVILDNKAYAKFKSGQKTTFADFLTALRIRDSLSDFPGIIISKLHLAEYFKNKDSARAACYALEAKSMALKTDNYKELLKTLLLLSKLKKHEAYSNLNQYISIQDSLRDEERKVRNKFARIRFETDQFIEQNHSLNQQKKWILTGSLGIVTILFLVITVRLQKIKNKELRLEQKQQKSNEAIYNLLLEQQNKLEETRNDEKMRISEELHDGVLSKIFGIRLFLGAMNSKSDRKSIQKRDAYLEELKQVEQDIRNISHNLNSNFLSSEISFLSIVEEFLMKQKNISDFAYSIKNDENIDWKNLSSQIKINFYRILQEAIHNINKYAGATKVSIIFKEEFNMLKMAILDNGKGFNIKQRAKGIGILNMYSRAKNLGGETRISSNNEGTQIFVEIPLLQYGKEL